MVVWVCTMNDYEDWHIEAVFAGESEAVQWLRMADDRFYRAQHDLTLDQYRRYVPRIERHEVKN